VGFLFFWPLVGIDPSPRRLQPVVRLAVVFASLPFHAFFGVALMSTKAVIGAEFYRALALPWVTDPLADQKLGGGLAWASGEGPLLIVILALLIQWSRQDERSARRDDRRADADGDEDLQAYNAMLRRLATGTATPGAGENSRKNFPDADVDDERRPDDVAEASDGPETERSGQVSG
jgi:putative copper resistance protein D